MTVSELISKLQTMDPNIKVVLYHAGSEDDGSVRSVDYCTVKEYHENTYCQGDSCLEIEDETEMVCKISADYFLVR